MPRKKKVGGFSVDFKKPAVTSDSWEPKATREEKDEADRRKMEARWNLDKLLEAEEIRNDPEKLKEAMAHADERMSRIKSIQDLRDIAEAKFGEGAKRKKV